MKKALHFYLLILLLLEACSEWSATPQRTLEHRGSSVDAMITGQLYSPDQAINPTTGLNSGMEGRKAETILQRTYQEDTGSPERVRAPGQLNIKGSSSSQSGSTSGGNGH